MVVGNPGDAWLRQLVALAQEARAGAMLETAIAVAHGGDLKQVAREGCAACCRTAEEIAVPLVEPGQIAVEPSEIGTMPATDRDVVGRSAPSNDVSARLLISTGRSISSSKFAVW